MSETVQSTGIQQQLRAQNFLVSFAKEKEKKPPTHLRAFKGNREGALQLYSSSIQSYLAGFSPLGHA